MRHWSQLAIRNWRAESRRTLGALLAITLGGAAIVWVTSSYESVRETTLGWAEDYIGSAHLSLSSPLGKFDVLPERLIPRIEQVHNVKTAIPVLQRVIRADFWPRPLAVGGAPLPEQPAANTPDFDFFGIDLKKEFLVRSYPLVDGRELRPGDDLACVLEAAFAEERRLGVGDFLVAWPTPGEPPVEIEVVGLFDRKRIASFQKPQALMAIDPLQRITRKSSLVTSIDVVLEDPSREALELAATRIRGVAKRVAGNVSLRSAEGKMRQIDYAQLQQSFMLAVLASVAMLTALFIILGTLSMGMVERVAQLGLARCVGVTRLQLAVIVLLEVVPLGILGVILAIPVGLAMSAATVQLVPEYVGQFAISVDGITLAVASGLVTTLVAGLLPGVAALSVSPLEATRPRGRRTGTQAIWLVTLTAVAALLFQHFYLVEYTRRSIDFVFSAALAVIALYFAYALFAPILIRVVSAPAVRICAWVLRIRYRLLQEQVGNAVWRSAGICCGLMVGLSLIVTLLTLNESWRESWRFPTRFPSAYIWSFAQLPNDTDDVIRSVSGVGKFTTANSVNVVVEEMPLIGADILRSWTYYMACDPDSFTALVQLEYVEGDEETAWNLLREGGHVIVTDDFSRSRNKHVGDSVKVFFPSNIPVNFKVAAVIRSPAIDVAATYFQLQSTYSAVASGSVIGTLDDLQRNFNIRGRNVVLLNFDLPADQGPPPDWPPPPHSAEGLALRSEAYDQQVPLDERWTNYREREVLSAICRQLNAPQASGGTIAALKAQIDSQLIQVTALLGAIPVFALLVAAFGVANLMSANVAARSRQLAVLRAVGATRGLVLRLVFGEAVVLGVLGSAMGLGLGAHLAYNVIDLIERMWGLRMTFHLPVVFVSAAAALTIVLCIIAGVLPARRAARTNVVEALHVA